MAKRALHRATSRQYHHQHRLTHRSQSLSSASLLASCWCRSHLSPSSALDIVKLAMSRVRCVSNKTATQQTANRKVEQSASRTNSFRLRRRNEPPLAQSNLLVVPRLLKHQHHRCHRKHLSPRSANRISTFDRRLASLPHISNQPMRFSNEIF
jgi:hypothetical protein